MIDPKIIELIDKVIRDAEAFGLSQELGTTKYMMEAEFDLKVSRAALIAAVEAINAL
jgi:hypothetical protein